jgi:hypothetical protein
MRHSGIYLEDAKQVIRMLDRYLSTQKEQRLSAHTDEKDGNSFTVLVKGEEEILLERHTEIVAMATFRNLKKRSRIS